MDATTFNNYMLGKRKPSLELAVAILRTFPDVSAEWLMRGEGTMKRTNTTATITNDNRRYINNGSGATGDGAAVSHYATTREALTSAGILIDDPETERLIDRADNTSRLLSICERLLDDPTVDHNRVLDILTTITR